MRQPLTLSCDHSGSPMAKVPFPCMWDLVEYLSFQRVVVSYQYEASHFTVTFPRMELATAQRILDEWTKSHAPEFQHI